MKYKNNPIYLLILMVIPLFSTLSLKAQVNIGSLDNPQSFSILELTAKQKDGGLRLPQLTTGERDDVAKQWTALDPESEIAKAAQGLVIYNKTTDCLEFWNGKEWISLCSDILPPPPTLEVTPEDMTFNANRAIIARANSIVTVTTNQAKWTATITYNQDNNWLTGVQPSGTDGQQFTVNVTSSTATLRTATITVTAGGLTRYVTIAQFPDNYTDSDPTDIGITPYVGAFWKHNQTGERLIRIPRPTGSTAADGAWTAAVISGSDWITLDTEMTSDPNVGWLTGAIEANVDNGNDTGFDAKHAIVNGSSRVTGTMDATASQMYFRIGLKSTLASDETAPRYGIVLLTYNNNNLSQRIFIRQGESADYLMTNNDAVNSGGLSGNRTQCRQFKPYNLTAKDDQMNSALDVNGGIWAAYPSQAGAYFQWANTTNPRFAWDPFSLNVSGWDGSPTSYYSGTYWDALIANQTTNPETCPSGYRRPTDGITTGDDTGPDMTSSEIRQSLYLNPQTFVTSSLTNSVWGYYADGFFDRRQITGGPAGSTIPGTNSSVSTGNNQIAHIGRLFYNPTTTSDHYNASLFFPATGYRYHNTGALYYAGTLGYYWSSSSSATNPWLLYVSSIYAFQTSYFRSGGVCVRCVKDE